MEWLQILQQKVQYYLTMMLKAAQKRSQLHQIREFKTKRLVQGIGKRDEKRKDMFDIQARLRNSVGIVRMNKEHRFNTLTPNFVSQVARGVETMELDHTVALIYLTTVEGQHFSNGTDFRTMLHYQNQGKDEKLASYIEDIYKLQTVFAKTNKPIMTVAPGHSFNSGAGLLAASGFPTICHDSKIAFNEVTFGYVPHAGSTYYGSRLPGDFGTFLILTGWPLTGKDAIKLGIADSLIEIPESYEHEICDIVLSMDPTSMPTSSRIIGKEGFGVHMRRPAEEAALQRARQIRQQDSDDTAELRTRLGQYSHDEPFLDPRDRKPDVIAMADLGYKKMLKDFNNSKYHQGGAGFFDHDAPSFNKFSYIHSYLKLHSGHIYSNNSVQTLLQHTQMIDRCFWPNSVEEIIDNLKRETHPFAQEILAKMECNSMLSMKLALKMLRNAKNMAYGEILKMELNVALNKVKDSEFELGVKEVLQKPSKTGRLGFRPNPGFKKEVSDKEVESYFEENKYAAKIDLDIVENSLLPTRHFFERFTDSIRVYINETSSPQPEIREAVKYEVQELLRAEGIDIRDKTVDVPMIRDYIDKKVRQEKQFNEMMRRSNQLVSDKKLRKWYFDGINSELMKLEDKKAFYSVVNSKIHKIFENAYFERLNLVYDKSKEAQSLEKRRMFIKMKKFLIKSRIMGYLSEETERLTTQLQSLPFKMIHLTENWEQSMRDVEHPELHKSVMYHLSKVVGKASLAPPEMVKDYLTNPEAAKSMTVYTFSKTELEKLQRDLMKNPEKYEKLLHQDFEEHEFSGGRDFGRFFEQREARSLRHQYNFKLQNDGRLNIEENYPMRVEYFKYKQWADDIKFKALHTLKYTVARLLVDFENDYKIENKTIEFSKEAKETKRDALQRLLLQLNERTASPQIQKKPQLVEQILNMGQRDIIEQDFYKLIDTDKDLSKLFGKSDSQNQAILDFRKEMLHELLQLVEMVLLGQNDMSQDALEERLADIVNPKNIQDNYTANLNLIDTYLGDKSGQRVLKEAIQFVKPFFLNVYQEKVNEEMKILLQAFNCHETSEETLEHYLAYSSNPEAFKNSKAIAKIKNFNEERMAFQNFQKYYPEDGERYAHRHILNMLGIGSTFAEAKSVRDMVDAARLEQRDYIEYNRLRGLPDVKIQEELEWKQEYRGTNLIPYDEQEDEHILKNPAFYQSLTQDEIDDIDTLTSIIQDAKYYIDTHHHEIQTLMTDADWLQVYTKSIKDYDLEMDHLIRATRNPMDYNLDLAQSIGSIGSGTDDEPEIPENNRVDWHQMAEYADFIANIDKAKKTIKVDNTEKVIEFLAKFDQGFEEHEHDLVRESIFRSVVDVETKEDKWRDRFFNTMTFQERVEHQAKMGLECLRLANYAPKETKDLVQNIVQQKSKYFDLEKLSEYLAQRDYSVEFNPAQFIDQELLIQDFHNGTALQDFMEKYHETKLDVVSLAEMRAVLNEATELDTDQFDDLLHNIDAVLEHVEEQMSFVSHDRRSQISLGEFLTKHHYLNSNSFRHYSSDLLKKQIQNAIGNIKDKEDSGAVIDWEMGNLITQANVDEDLNIEDKLLQTASGDIMGSRDSFELLDEKTGLKTKETNLTEIIYEEARKATKLTPEMDSLRNLYENKLLKEYTKENYDPKVIESYVQDYMTARIKDCSLKLDFAKALKSEHAHIYVKTLRERIMDELSLDEGTTADEFQWHSIHETIDTRFYEPDSKYNLNHLNNDQAIGYRNLEERAKNVDSNKKVAHECVFDEMLADYFLQKRGDYKKGNKLMQDLEQIFDSNIENPNDRHPLAGDGQNTLGFHYMRQTVGKDEAPELIPYNFPALLELDIAVNKQLHNNKGGLSQKLRDWGDEKFLIPEFFDHHDVRKPADLYVMDKLQEILDELFAARRKLEKHLSRGELVAYDKVLAKYLTHDTLLGKLKREIYKDYNELEQLNQMVNHDKDSERSMQKQLRKTRNYQPEFNKGVINEDAFYKHLAYTGLLEKKRRDNRKQTLEDPVLTAGYESFENYYQDTLIEEAKLPARKIDPNVFAPKKQTKITGTSDRKDYGYLDMKGRRELFLEEHAQYKENKLEQQERIETFYILEQFFNKQKKNPVDQSNQLFQAQEHIREYFSEPENTHFFDKNRIH